MRSIKGALKWDFFISHNQGNAGDQSEPGSHATHTTTSRERTHTLQLSPEYALWTDSPCGFQNVFDHPRFPVIFICFKSMLLFKK